ncbi:MAG: ion transporter [Burkholderiales bacterium]|nr:ion transporter [Burkholderiales bacterium]
MIDTAPARLTLWQIVILALSAYVLAALFVQTLWALPAEVATVLDWADNAICVVFLGDFAYHLATAPNRWTYLKWGWIDLVSSIPTLDVLRWGRTVRVLRILRVLRAVRSVRTLLAIIFERRAAGLFAATAVASFLLVVGSAIAILNLEPGTRIRTASDALWWAFEMLISQGSGLYNPVTVEGRLVATALAVAGFVLMGAFVAGIAASALGVGEQKIEREEEEILAELRAIRERLDALERGLPPGNGAARSP